MIKVYDLKKDFSGHPVLSGISFSLEKGETLSLIGPSGCGKTTLLYIIAGLMQPSSGRLETQSTNSAIILQDFGLFPWKTVRQNIGLGLKLSGADKEEVEKTTENLLFELDIEELKNRFPAQLSGGQKQRVAVARALAVSPSLLLMDEPFSSIDALTRERLQDFLLQIWQQRRLTCILVTHSIEEAVFLSKRIIVLSERPARIKGVVKNPDFGKTEFRRSIEYFEKIREVRSVLQKA